jgi:hypothetical protein
VRSKSRPIEIDSPASRSGNPPEDEQSAAFQSRAHLFATARKVLRASIVQFGSEAFAAGLEAGK